MKVIKGDTLSLAVRRKCCSPSGVQGGNLGPLLRAFPLAFPVKKSFSQTRNVSVIFARATHIDRLRKSAALSLGLQW